ncbi:MAG: TetR/AcrR family transcriptional regulator [Thermodesulfobacteriota bacterium]
MKSALDKVREAPGSTKARILAAAQEVFAAKGFEGASTREIAARAEVNISSLHYHWESKERLYLAIFERIFQQLVDLLRDEIVMPASPDDARAVVERAMGLTFDFYVENPTIPKLLMRRMMESDAVEPSEMRAALAPNWKQFAEWTRSFTGNLPERDVSFFMLTVQSVLFVSMLDTPFVSNLLGGSIHDPAVRARVRKQLIQLVETLLGLDGVHGGGKGGGRE